MESSSHSCVVLPKDAQEIEAMCESVVSRIELLPDKTAKFLFRLIYFSVAMSFVVLLTQVSLKADGQFEVAAARFSAGIANAVVASACACAMFCAVVHYINRLFKISFWHLKWCPRRTRWTTLQIAELSCQFLNAVFFLVPNLLLVIKGENEIHTDHILMLAVMRFTMWNTISFLMALQARMLNLWVDEEYRPVATDDGILLDAPWRCHWPLALYWFLLETGIIAVAVWVKKSYAARGRFGVDFKGLCADRTPMYLIITTVSLVFVAYLIMALCFVRNGYEQLKKKPYKMFRWINVKLRYHNIQILVVGCFMVASYILLSVVHVHACRSTLLVLFGMIPPQLAMTVLSVVNGYFMTPVEIGSMRLHMDELLSWNESNQHLERVPVFSFETAVKMWYWSLLPYRIQSSNDEITVGVAKKLYDLRNHDVIIDKASDVIVVVGWSSSTVVISFRGTSSAENLKSDMRAWRTDHPPTRGNLFKGTRPLVHEGFLTAWTRSGLNATLIKKIKEILDGDGIDVSKVQVILTGHSMGGALSILAGFDLARYCSLSPRQLMCYTFGAPRLGNKAFAAEYDGMIPDTWQVVNGNDLVPSIPEFGPLFAHVGKRVIINEAGDMIVRPLFVENNLHRFFQFLGVSRSMTQHLMRNYRSSLAAIARAQFIKRKGVPGGMQSILRSFFHEGRENILEDTLGLNIKSLDKLHRKGTAFWTMNQSERSLRRRIWGKLVRGLERMGAKTVSRKSLQSGLKSTSRVEEGEKWVDDEV
ncbi:hypothetical protein BSKO_13920 [Bryopsis sp. KO-2023]|nr:hypothetical protein BSKO_13920 [Bryopsis sp. KO-2023]